MENQVLYDDDFYLDEDNIRECLDEFEEDNGYRPEYYELANMDFDFVIDDLEFYCKNNKIDHFAVVGNLGLWNGRHDIYPKTFNSIKDAIYACTEDFNKIYIEDNELCIKAIHHDGINYFTIKRCIFEDGYDPYGDYLEYKEFYPLYENIDVNKIRKKYYLINYINGILNGHKGAYYYTSYCSKYICVNSEDDHNGNSCIKISLVTAIDNKGKPAGETLKQSFLLSNEIESNDEIISFITRFIDEIQPYFNAAA